jgi:hypothetical protein
LKPTLLQLTYHPEAMRQYRRPDEPGYVSCVGPELCGGCDSCLAAQDEYYEGLEQVFDRADLPF